MAISTKPYKGTRDFYPEDKRTQKYIFSVLRKTVEGFGYQEYDAPIVEPIEIYMSKTSEEIVVEQTFVFTDRGGRTVTLRPEMTPTVSRMVAAKRQELAYPLRLYSIPNLWRYERPQHGRLREHYQLNVDIFGVSGLEADHEIILVADSILKAFGAKTDQYEIRVNSRQLVNWLLTVYLKFDHVQVQVLMRLLDKQDKMPEKDFIKSIDNMLTPSQIEGDVLRKLRSILKAKKLVELPLEVQQHPAADQLSKLFGLLENSGVSSARFDPGLMRGFDYYTNIVFEVFDKHPENNRAMFGGGRYDGLIAQFGVEPLPTVGFGMGDVTLQNFIETHKLLPTLQTETDAVIILIGDVYEKAQPVLASFREEGLRVAVDSSGKKTDARLRSAVKSKVPYAIFLGEKELESGRYKLKNLSTGHEEEHGLERTVSAIASRHKEDDVLEL